MPKTKTSNSKRGLGGRLRITPRTLSIFVAIVFVLGVAGYGTYRMGRGHAASANDVWNYGLAISGCPPVIYGSPAPVRQGNSGGCVRLAQHLLNLWNSSAKFNNAGYYTYTVNPDKRLDEDGVFGPKTAQQVSEFQRYAATYVAYRGHDDGVVGYDTWGAFFRCLNGPNWNCLRYGLRT